MGRRAAVRKILNRYSLTKEPFTKVVPVDELYEHPGADQALQRLKAAVEGRSSAVLTGDPGTGKTFVLRRLEAKLPAGRYRVTYIHNSTVNLRDFYRQVSNALGLEPKTTPAALFRSVSAHIEELAAEQKVHPVLALDEAHLLTLPVLEHLHILLNYQKDSQPFLSLILLGLPELRERLTRNVLSSLAARLPVRIHLPALTAAQVGEYVRHRLKMAGCGQDAFGEDAVLLMAEATGGVLRKIDILATTCLEVACEGRGTVIDAGVVEKAVEQCAEALA